MVVKAKGEPQVAQEVTVRLPMVAVEAKRLVDEAVVEKKLVVVALVPVAEVKERVEKLPVPETVALVSMELLKV